jgi:predicted site-specific integrase-resolvase
MKKNKNTKQREPRSIPAFYTFKQACAIAHVSSSTMHRMIKAGKIKALQPTGPKGNLIFVQGNLLEFLTNRAKK